MPASSRWMLPIYLWQDARDYAKARHTTRDFQISILRRRADRETPEPVDT